MAKGYIERNIGDQQCDNGGNDWQDAGGRATIADEDEVNVRDGSGREGEGTGEGLGNGSACSRASPAQRGITKPILTTLLQMETHAIRASMLAQLGPGDCSNACYESASIAARLSAGYGQWCHCRRMPRKTARLGGRVTVCWSFLMLIHLGTYRVQRG